MSDKMLHYPPKNKNAGTNKTVNYTGVVLSGDKAANYTIASTATGKGTINKKALSLVADSKTVTQDEEASFTGKVEGFVDGEGLADASDLTFTADTTGAPGPHAITGKLKGNTSGDYGDNYTFTNAAANATALTIEAKASPDPVNPDPVNPGPVNPNPANPDPALPEGLALDTIMEEENLVSSLEDEDRKEAKYIAEAAQGEGKPDSHISAAENSTKVEGAMSEEEFAHQQYVLQHPEEAEGSGE